MELTERTHTLRKWRCEFCGKTCAEGEELWVGVLDAGYALHIDYLIRHVVYLCRDCALGDD